MWVNCGLFNAGNGQRVESCNCGVGENCVFLCHWIQEDCSTVEEVSVFFFFVFVNNKLSRP